MHKDQKILLELVVVLALVGFGLWSMKESSVPVPVPASDTNQTVGSANKNTGVGNINANTPAVPISYSKALEKYKDARIQLDQECRAIPTYATYKNNTSIMIDNRSSITRTVKVGSVFFLKAYDFKIVKLSSATLPATWYVDCGTSQNVATILIQK